MTHEQPSFEHPASAEIHATGEAATPFDRDLLTAHYGWVQAVARNLEHDRASAEDVTQETLLAALSAPPKLVTDASHLRAWLGRVAFNLSRLGARQGARRRAREERVARSEMLPSVCEAIEAKATLASLSQAIQSLPDSSRSVVVMRYFEGLSTVEIARRTGTTELGVRKRLWRARDKLRGALEREFGAGRGMGLLAPLSWLWSGLRAPGKKLALGVASSVAAIALVVVAATPWTGTPSGHGRLELAFLDEATVGGARESGRTAVGSPADGTTGVRQADVLPSRARTPLVGNPPPPQIVPGYGDRPNVLGLVLDLEGAPRAGLTLADAEHAETPLATTDLLGGFSFRARVLPPVLEARAPGWTTVLPARVAEGRSKGLMLVVAPAADLAGQVVDGHGQGLGGVRFEVHCDESAWTAFDRPVRLESPLFCSFASDDTGAFARPALPRARGFRLRVSCPGYATVERETMDLGQELRLVLCLLPPEEELSGIVLHRDGRPAGGANVRLAEASTRADGRGRYHLPLRGLRADSVLEAWDVAAAPVRVQRFGEQLEKSPASVVDIVLGEEDLPVSGELVDSEGKAAEDWRVLAFRATTDPGSEPAGAPEVALADVRTDEHGRFAVHLPAGPYLVYALAPDGLRVVRGGELDSLSRRWTVALPAAPELAAVAGHVHSDLGQGVRGARVQVRCRLDGPRGQPLVPWRELATDASGAFAFRADPGVGFELCVEHPDFAGNTWSGHARVGARLEVALQRPAFLRVAGAEAGFESIALLDEAGAPLVARGPLHATARVPLYGGSSAVVEVPTGTQWVQVQGTSGSLKLPVAPRAGAVLTLRP